VHHEAVTLQYPAVGPTTSCPKGETFHSQLATIIQGLEVGQDKDLQGWRDIGRAYLSSKELWGAFLRILEFGWGECAPLASSHQAGRVASINKTGYNMGA